MFLTSYAKTLIALNPNNNHANPTTTSLLLVTESCNFMEGNCMYRPARFGGHKHCGSGDKMF